MASRFVPARAPDTSFEQAGEDRERVKKEVEDTRWRKEEEQDHPSYWKSLYEILQQNKGSYISTYHGLRDLAIMPVKRTDMSACLCCSMTVL